MTIPEIVLTVCVVALLFLWLFVASRLPTSGEIERLQTTIEHLSQHAHYHDADGTIRRDAWFILGSLPPRTVADAIIGTDELPDDTDFGHAIGRCPYCHETVFDDDPAAVIYDAAINPDGTERADVPLHRACYVKAHAKEPDPAYIVKQPTLPFAFCGDIVAHDPHAWDETNTWNNPGRKWCVGWPIE